MKEAHKRAEEIQRVVDIASVNLAAFDQDITRSLGFDNPWNTLR